jgi:O-antigen/teichoic acid export membrane protein
MSTSRQPPQGGGALIARRAQGVVRNALWNVVPFGWSVVLSLATTAFFIRSIGLSHFGLYGLLTVMLTPLGLANLGFSSAAIKYVAEHQSKGELAEARRYLETVYWMSLAVGIAGGVLLAAVGAPIMNAVFRISEEDRILVTRSVPLLGVLWLFQQAAGALSAIPAAFSSFREVAIGNIVVQTLTAAAQVAMVMAGHGVFGMVVGAAIGAAAGWITWYVLGRVVTSATPGIPRLHRDVWFTCLHFGGWQTVGQIGGLLATQAERFILGHYLLPIAVGAYNAAFRLEQAAYAVGYKMSEVLFPHFSEHSLDEQHARMDMLMRASWLLTTAAVCLLGPLIPLAGPTLLIWAGAETAQLGTSVLATLAVGGILGCATNASYFFLLAGGHTRWTAVLAIATGVVVTIASLILVPRFGLIAAAISGVLGASAQALLVTWMLRQLFGRQLAVRTIFFSLYAPVLFGVAAALLLSLLPIDLTGWPSLLLAYGGVAILVAVCVIVLGVLTPGGAGRSRDIAWLWGQTTHLLGVTGRS